MITQRAKLRRLAFIRMSLAASTWPVPAILPGTLADSARRDPIQCRCRTAYCQGNHRYSALCHSALAVVWARRSGHVRRWLRVRVRRSACRRGALDHEPARREGDQRSSQGSAAIAHIRSPMLPAHSPAPHRAPPACRVGPVLLADIGRWRGRGVAVPPRPAAGRMLRIETRAVCRSAHRRSHNFCCTRPKPASRSRHRRAACARQQREPARVEPSRASAGITARSRARVKRGSRFEASSAKPMPARASVAMSRDFGMSSSGRTSVIPCRTPASSTRTPSREPGDAAAARQADQHGLGLIVERVRDENMRRLRLPAAASASSR